MKISWIPISINLMINLKSRIENFVVSCRIVRENGEREREVGRSFTAWSDYLVVAPNTRRAEVEGDQETCN